MIAPIRTTDASQAIDTEMASHSRKMSIAKLIFSSPFRADTWRRTAYGVACFPLAAISFALVIPGTIVGTVLMITVILGAIILLVLFALTRTVGSVHRWWARIGLGLFITPPARLRLSGGPLARLRIRVTDPRTWRDLAFMIINLPAGFAVTALSIYPWLQTIYSLSYPIVQRNTTFTADAWGGPSWIGAVAVHTLPGIPMLFLAPWLVYAATWLHGRLVRAMLGGRARTGEPADGV